MHRRGSFFPLSLYFHRSRSTNHSNIHTMSLLRTTNALSSTAWAAVVLSAMAPLFVNAQQKAFIDCSESFQFESIATSGIPLALTFNSEEVALPFAFPFIDGNSYDALEVIIEASFRLGIDRSISVASTPGLLESTDVYYQENDSDSESVVFSWENLFFAVDGQVTVGPNNAQATLFPNGDITLCYGSGDIGSTGVAIDARLGVPNTRGVPVEVLTFTNGRATTWPANACACFTTLTDAPTNEPTDSPSNSPTESQAPSDQPSTNPSASSAPSDQPSNNPSVSSAPSSMPSISPSESQAPSNQPTFCLKKRKTKSPGYGRTKSHGKKSGSTTKSPVQTCFDTAFPTKSPGKGMKKGKKDIGRT